MEIAEFEKYIQQEIDPDLTIKRNYNTADFCNGVMFRGYSIGCVLPPREILEYPHQENADPSGVMYRSIPQAIEHIHYKLKTNKYATES